LRVKHILIWGAKSVRATHFPLDIPVRHAHTASDDHLESEP